MQQIDSYQTYQQVVNEHYAMLANPATGPWPVGILKLACWQASLSTAAAPRMAAIAANALASFPADVRARFTETYAVPGSVLGLLDSPPDWPELTEVEELMPYDEADMERVRNVFSVRLSMFTEAQTQRVVPGGLYSAMTYIEKRLEATFLLAAVDEGETPEPEAYPLMASEMQFYGNNLTDVANTIMQKSAAWSSASASINTILQSAQRELAEAETLEDAQAIMHAAQKGIKQVADAVLGIVELGETGEPLDSEDAGDDMEEVPEGEEGAFDPAIADDAHEEAEVPAVPSKAE